jgi:hypothetical protein
MYLHKTLLAKVGSHGLIDLREVAANNLLGGRTTHSRFKIPL